MIKAVIFDMGGVLLEPVNHEYYSRIQKKTGIDYMEIKSFIHSQLKYFESGRMNESEFEGRLAKRFNIKKSEVQWATFLRDNGSEKKDTMKLARRIGKNYRIACITNVDRARYYYSKYIIDTSIFSFILASCYNKASKPDRRIYLKALRKLGIKPEEAIFIDDTLINVEGAASLGIKAIQFKGTSDLKAQLKRFGVEV